MREYVSEKKKSIHLRTLVEHALLSIPKLLLLFLQNASPEALVREFDRILSLHEEISGQGFNDDHVYKEKLNEVC